jgi:hypothetical protein
VLDTAFARGFAPAPVYVIIAAEQEVTVKRFAPLVVSLALGALATSALAAANPAKPAAPTGERVVCKKAAPAGTRFRTETCYTADEWDRLSEAAKRDLGEVVFREPKRKRSK